MSVRILCDMDGVLSDTLPTWLAEYRAISADNVHVKDIKAYGFDKFVKHPKLLWRALTSGDVFRKAAPMPGAIEALRWLNAHHEVYIVTYSHESVLDGHRAKLDWLRHWAPFLAEDQVVFTKRKALVDGDVMIEDHSANLYNWLLESPKPGDRYGYLVDHLYNRNTVLDKLERSERVNGLMDVAESLK